ncbi:hypothetical protein AKJ47_02745 [candidate division MSBL1 archaeon SCGC-AAA261G05]|uniref:RmlD-like substrate binding domain-containing protein n=1 Tax=candidate division MSBL1 archaeon SCGC-AAA261G05 TaxID=1698276 RepID=A0A133V9T6_9EURY|nr:hypothetical protein AKJ47_02745 [candidate division MSBL1 archaeon SCGC-AAA261G05]
MRILVTGSTGLLGHRTVDLAIDSGHKVYSTYRTEKYPKGEPIKLDLRNSKKIKELLEKTGPDVIINTAAFTDVDGCENNPEKAYEVNAKAPKILAKISDKIDTHLIHVSTDYVFDGEKGNYSEEDTPNPQCVYGKTKLEGERNVQENCSSWTIARTSVLYGWEFKDKFNFATWIIKELSDENPIQIVKDQYNSPTLNTNLAEILVESAEKRIDGLYHIACSSKVDRYEFSVKIAKTFDLNSELIKKTTMHDMNWNAPRPKDSSLDVSKSKETFENKILNCDESLQRMRNEEKDLNL